MEGYAMIFHTLLIKQPFYLIDHFSLISFTDISLKSCEFFPYPEGCGTQPVALRDYKTAGKYKKEHYN
jgi:hypothetical protein